MLSRLAKGTFKSLFTSTSRSRDLSTITRIPLCTPIEGEFGSKYKNEVQYVPFDSKLTTLDSNIRVASEPHYGDYCTIGVAIESGSRYEAGYPLGTSHIVEKLAFGSTTRHSSKEEIYSVLQENGGLIDCQSTRDTFIYAASCHISGLDAITEIIANAIWRAKNTEDELTEAKMIVQYEIEDMPKKIESVEPLMTDWLHKAAFRDNTLGFSKYTTEAVLPNISEKHINSYMYQYHAPERIVVAGVGVEHSDLVAAVERHFEPGTSTWAKNPNILLPELPPIDRSIAQYSGGEVRVEKDLSTLAVGTPYPNLAHVALGFEGVSYRDSDFVAFCVLHTLLGGGGSFSAGGPGKGMYTRLYTDVMNRCHWIYGATAYNHSYADAGLFCIHASSGPEQINDVLIVILDQFFKLSKGIEKEELERAKIQLKSQLMMNLEVRPVMFEDLARQVIGHGYRRKPDEYLEKIEKVTADDIIRAGERMLSCRPSVVGYGDIGKLASYEAVDDAVAKRRLQGLGIKKKTFVW
ncbi:peptidase M16 inactive domain protein [Dictyocaulus viviparus]|uniref:Alpha-MPP n=1 Tax=Dictyocaulus viviparus TaxID=29172 RepID=A0A0D8XFT7_DICVI|nr:peptidase M16 inactive domain protein [Dictyocaulus viviparus]